MASINNLTAVYANKLYLASSTGVSEIFLTPTQQKQKVENLNFTTDIAANTDAIAVFKRKAIAKFQ